MSSPHRAPWLGLTVLLVVAAIGCKEEPKQTPPPIIGATAKASAASSAKASSKAGSSYKDTDLPVPADFEEDADKNISGDNYKDALAKEEESILGAKPDAGSP